MRSSGFWVLGCGFWVLVLKKSDIRLRTQHPEPRTLNSTLHLEPCTLNPINKHSYNDPMRYLVTGRVKPGRRAALDRAIDDGSLGRGSIAGDEYFRNMDAARELEDGRVQWVEVCYCPTPLAEEQPY